MGQPTAGPVKFKRASENENGSNSNASGFRTPSEKLSKHQSIWTLSGIRLENHKHSKPHETTIPFNPGLSTENKCCRNNLLAPVEPRLHTTDLHSLDHSCLGSLRLIAKTYQDQPLPFKQAGTKGVRSLHIWFMEFRWFPQILLFTRDYKGGSPFHTVPPKPPWPS